MSQFLEVELDEEERILSNSQIQPRADVQLSDITDLQNQIDPARIFEELMSKIYDTHDEVKKRINLEKSLVAVEFSDEDENTDRADEKKEKPKKKKPIAPKYKIIEGSLFAVDAFRYGEISHVGNFTDFSIRISIMSDKYIDMSIAFLTVFFRALLPISFPRRSLHRTKKKVLSQHLPLENHCRTC